MKGRTIRSDLVKVRARLNNEGQWCQGSECLNANFTLALPWAPSAKMWSLVGAVKAEQSPFEVEMIKALLALAGYSRHKPKDTANEDLQRWQDRATHEQVLNLVDACIAQYSAPIEPVTLLGD